MAVSSAPETRSIHSPLKDASEPARLSTGASRWALGALTMAGLLAAINRNALALLLSPIKLELHASDTAMGALTGIAFALVYATAALPIARLADTSSRRNIMAAAIGVWSVATSAGGLATSYIGLLVSRIGVAAGESPQIPVTFSMIGDLYPNEKRGGALAVYSVGSTVGFAGGAWLTGLLNERFGWHVTLVALGLPGLLLGMIIWLTVREPNRGAHDGPLVHDPDAISFSRSLRRILSIRTILPLIGASICLNVSAGAWLGWLPAFLMRVHHMTSGQMSFWLMMIIMTAVPANIFAGFGSDAMTRRGSRWRMYFCVTMSALALPLVLLGLLLHAAIGAVICMSLFSLASGGVYTVSYAATLSIARPGTRALLTAVLGLVVTIVGAGGGPLLVGALNDGLHSRFGDQAIRYTMLVVPAAVALSGLMFLWASWTIDEDVATARGAPLAD